MTEGLLKELAGISFDSLTAKDAVRLRAALKTAMQRSEEWFTALSRQFEMPKVEKTDKEGTGRPPALNEPSRATPPGKTATTQRRGRPVPPIKVKLPKHRKAEGPAPLAIGGADSEQPREVEAQLFQQSYVSKDGPRGDVPAVLPPDHPRRTLHRESSVTPEVDMSDFHEVEEALRNGTVNSIFGQHK